MVKKSDNIRSVVRKVIRMLEKALSEGNPVYFDDVKLNVFEMTSLLSKLKEKEKCR